MDSITLEQSEQLQHDLMTHLDGLPEGLIDKLCQVVADYYRLGQHKGEQGMKKLEVDHWVVIVGNPVFVCKTRKRARQFVKENKALWPCYNYVGKCIKDSRKIVLDI